jgi:hypothetical protein
MALAQAAQKIRSEPFGRSHKLPQRSQYFNSNWIA